MNGNTRGLASHIPQGDVDRTDHAHHVAHSPCRQGLPDAFTVEWILAEQVGLVSINDHLRIVAERAKRGTQKCVSLNTFVGNDRYQRHVSAARAGTLDAQRVSGRWNVTPLPNGDLNVCYSHAFKSLFA